MNIDINQQHKKCETKLLWAIEKLGYAISPNAAKKITSILVESMTGQWRYFHNLDHIFLVGNSDKPLEVLAALFHDCVYLQVDHKINFNLCYYLTPYIEEEKDSSFVIKKDSNQDLIFKVVYSIFDFHSHQNLSSFKGQNEFLSALVAVKILEPFLPVSLLAKIATIIEATIPFRPKSEDNLTAIESLYRRLQITNKKFNLGLSLDEIKETMGQCVRLVNRDVSSFASKDVQIFLRDTWKLLPETNHNLVNFNSYTIQDYRFAIQKMESFINFLQPELIFVRFQNEPSQEKYLSYFNQAKKNLAIGRVYLTSKLISICLLEAISLRIGDNFPLVSLFNCSLKNDQDSNYLSEVNLFLHQEKFELKNQTIAEKEALNLLQQRENKSSEFDHQISIITTFLAVNLGFKNLLDLRSKAINFINKTITNEDFICYFSPHLVNIIINDLVNLIEQRKQELILPKLMDNR